MLVYLVGLEYRTSIATSTHNFVSNKQIKWDTNAYIHKKYNPQSGNIQQ